MSKLFCSFMWTILCGLLLSFNNPGHLPANPTEDLMDIEYHQQETNFYCGAACAQMVLHQIGVPHTSNVCSNLGQCQNNTALCQGCLYVESYETSGHLDEEDWYSYPDGLQNTLNNHRPPDFAARFRFALFEETDKAVITQKIVWTIHHYKVAPIVLVYSNRVSNGLHWIVVKGYESSSDPMSSDDDQFRINDISGFYIYDPLPQVPASPPPPHSTNDGCGTGNPNGLDRGNALQFVPRDEFIREYLVPVNGDSYWKDKILAICDPDKGPKKGKRVYEDTALFSGDKIIKPKIAKILALQSLTKLGIDDNPSLPKQVKNAKAGDPILVKRIDHDNDFYYIVPLKGTDDKNHGIVNIDARFGKYKQLSFPANNGYTIDYKVLSKPEIVLKLKSFLELKFKKLISPLSSKAVRVLPDWIWTPCKESLSPFYPFQVVLYNYQLFYIRIDGQVFETLSLNGKGM